MSVKSRKTQLAEKSAVEQVGAGLQFEIDRSVTSLRNALGSMAKKRSLHASLMGVLILLDKVEFHVIYDVGESAFELDEVGGIVSFRSNGLEAVLSGAQTLVDEVGISDHEERAHFKQLSIDLFVAHELLHICQNFPHFPTVQEIKYGLPGIGLPLLDAVADIVAASICAHAEHMRLGEGSEEDFLKRFANTLVVSYAIGSLIFDARTKPEKRQRALGLLVSAMMIQAFAENRLEKENVNLAWKPTSPLLLLNIETTGTFNAFVVDEIAGVLFPNHSMVSKEIATQLWNSVGKSPIMNSLNLVSTLLLQVGAIKAENADQYGAIESAD
jgi:hypothetical protein